MNDPEIEQLINSLVGKVTELLKPLSLLTLSKAETLNIKRHLKALLGILSKAGR